MLAPITPVPIQPIRVFPGTICGTAIAPPSASQNQPDAASAASHAGILSSQRKRIEQSGGKTEPCGLAEKHSTAQGAQENGHRHDTGAARGRISRTQRGEERGEKGGRASYRTGRAPARSIQFKTSATITARHPSQTHTAQGPYWQSEHCQGRDGWHASHRNCRQPANHRNWNESQ